MAVALTLIMISVAARPSNKATSPEHHRSDEGVKTAKVEKATDGDRAEGIEPQHRSHASPSRSPFAPYVVAVLLGCLYLGALLQLLAQYFGVLGLTVNATPTVDTAVGAVRNSDYNNFLADSWAIGRGLSTFATLAWTSALACAGLATTMFRTPRYAKVV